MTDQMTSEEQDIFTNLLNTLRAKNQRNRLKQRYYDGKNVLKDLGISIPPQLRNVETVVGWPAKAVDMLAARSMYEGFVSKERATTDELNNILEDNQFSGMYRQAVTSELINSCSFFTLSKGEKEEPEVIISVHSAENASALWDGRKKRISAGLVVLDTGNLGNIERCYMYLDDYVLELFKTSYGTWKTNRYPHAQGRPLMEALRYCPTIHKPFGKSRISRAVMSITDSAVRAALRTEVAAEFFTAPQKYLLGASEDVFADTSKWEAYIGTMFAISKDEDGDLPQFGQLTQMSMQPHIDYIRSLAARFAGETGLPISSLGVIHDNPASAEAIYAAKEDLVIEAERLNDTNALALKNIALLALAIKRNTSIDSLSRDDKNLAVRFKNPSLPSVVSVSDAITKQISAIPWLGDTDVALEMLGYTHEQILRLQDQKRRASVINALAALTPPSEKTGIAAHDEAEEY